MTHYCTIEASLKEAAENAKLKLYPYGVYVVDKESITDKRNHKLV